MDSATSALTLLLAAATACSSPLSDEADDGFFFPRQLDGVSVMEAIVVGELGLVGQCLVLRYGDEESPLVVVWPADFGFQADGQSIRVLDGSGRVAVQTQERVFLSGGHIRSLDGIGAISDGVRRELAERCPGTYWFVGSEVRLANGPWAGDN